MAKSRGASVVRVVAALCYMIASIIMFTRKQQVEERFIDFVTRYTDGTGLLFCAVINIPVCVYNIIVLRIPSDSLLWSTVPFIDMMLCVLTGSSLGVGWQIYRYSVLFPRTMSTVGGVVPNFCVRVLWSMICSTIGFVFSFCLLAYSILLSNGLFESFYV